MNTYLVRYLDLVGGTVVGGGTCDFTTSEPLPLRNPLMAGAVTDFAVDAVRRHPRTGVTGQVVITEITEAS